MFDDIKIADTPEKDITINSDEKSLELYSDEYPFRLPLRIRNFENESEGMKFIKNCERLIRASTEYKQWRRYIIDVLGINTCMVTEERMDQVSIEVHHHLPSMFILVKALINKKIAREEEFCTFDIAQDAINLHFQNKVGYITLINSMHEKFHNGYLSIPKRFVRGDYIYFIREYSEFLDSDDLDILNERMATTESNCGWVRNNYQQSP